MGGNQSNRVTKERRRKLVTSLANGFDFATLDHIDRKWLRQRMLVNQTGRVTDKGKQWACKFLADEADKLMAEYGHADFAE